MDTTSEEEAEALRHKTLAESKYNNSNLKSAIKHARKALRLSPALDGVAEMVTAFKILRVAAKSSSSPDWYKILQLEPFSPINTIKKQYKKLALTLHPDKNSLDASEEAFKLVGEAFRVLTDKNRRREFDARVRAQIEAAVTAAGSVETFWTACSTCRLFHEFPRRYIGHNLMCPSCKKSFLAVEVEVASSSDVEARDGVRSTVGVRDMEELNTSSGEGSRILGSNRKAGMGKGLMGLGMERKLSSLLDSRKVGGKELKGFGAEKKMDSLGDSNRDIGGDDRTGILSSKRKVGICGVGKGLMGLSAERKLGALADLKGKTGRGEESRRLSLRRQMAGVEMSDEGTKNLGSKRRRGVASGSEEKSRNVRPKRKMGSVGEILGMSKMKDMGNGEEMTLAEMQLEVSRKAREEKMKVKLKEKEKEKEKRKMDSVWKSGDLEVMTVEDSEFYDFDKDKAERCFKKGQIWAVYDDDDGMPRHYGLIDEVTVNPFEVKMSWLDFQSNAEERLISWEKSGFHVSCGRFKVGKKTCLNSVNCFSHLADCERVAREVYRVYPKKGSIWALYKEHDLGTEGRNSLDRDHRCYDIVAFLTSYSEIHGLSMAYLEKVDGFRTVFKRREIGCNAVRWLEKDDVRLFSHQIPARKLSGSEAPDVSKDCWELDPASLPSELLRIGWRR